MQSKFRYSTLAFLVCSWISCFKAEEGENFALKKPTKQSTTYKKQFASKAVDGNKDNHYASCTHTYHKSSNPWWRVDLEQRIAVTHVKIVNRNSVGERLDGFEIRIGDSLTNNGTTNKRCGSPQRIPSNQEGIVSCVPEVIGRYVTVFIPGEDKILTLCEVEVYGTSALGNQSRTRIELVGSNLPYQGYIVNNTETLCDPTWSMIDANVACIQLGYPGVDESHWNNSYPGNIASLNEGKTVERRYNCSGTEGSLNDCPQIIIDGKNTCRKRNDISVTCQPYIRLGGSDIPLKGRLEVFHSGIWGTVCGFSPSFEDRSSRVACRELGFHDVLNQGSWDNDKASGKILLKDVKCSGDEKSLVFCPHSNWKNTGCNHADAIFVKCSICSNGLLEDNALFPDSIFNASAARLPGYGPSSGRLYNLQAWCLPESIAYENQFLEITLPGIFSLSAVATVGGELGYVTSYMLSYIVSGYTWKYASVGTQKLIFGNTNDETHNVIRRDLDSPIHAEKVRFIPKTWQRIPCLRVELCGKEIPRCNPRNITTNNLTSNSVLISWLPVLLPANSPDKNYSVTITSDADRDIQYFKTTELYLLILNLLPHHRYTCIVKTVGLEECFDEEIKLHFETKQAAPSGPPRYETAKWIGIGIAGAAVIIIILAILICFSRKRKTTRARKGSSNKTTRDNNAGNKSSHFNEVVQHDNYDPNQSLAMENVAADASHYETVDCTLDKNTKSETVEEMYSNVKDPSGSQEFTHVIQTAKGNLHADSSTYMSLSDPESVYQSLQSSEITADPQYSNGGDDESLTYMSLHENREAPNVYQSLQHAREITI